MHKQLAFLHLLPVKPPPCIFQTVLLEVSLPLSGFSQSILRWVGVLFQVDLSLCLSQICSQICPKCFWEFPTIVTYYTLHASYYACVMLQYEQH